MYLRYQVDENMQRAQKRDAVLSEKFFFRKDVFPPGSTTPSSAASESSCCGCGDGKAKEKKLKNCFPPLPKPANGYVVGSVHDEYEEMTMEEIMGGKVGRLSFMQAVPRTEPLYCRGRISRAS